MTRNLWMPPNYSTEYLSNLQSNINSSPDRARWCSSPDYDSLMSEWNVSEHILFDTGTPILACRGWKDNLEAYSITKLTRTVCSLKNWLVIYNGITVYVVWSILSRPGTSAIEYGFATHVNFMKNI